MGPAFNHSVSISSNSKGEPAALYRQISGWSSRLGVSFGDGTAGHFRPTSAPRSRAAIVLGRHGSTGHEPTHAGRSFVHAVHGRVQRYNGHVLREMVRGALGSFSRRDAEQLNNHTTQPAIPRLVVIPRMPVLPHGKTIYRNRARMNGQIARLRECFADVTWQRGHQIGRLDDRSEPEETRQ